MVNVSFCDINVFDNNQTDYYLNLLPHHLREEIRRYKNFSDRKARLIARLMLYKALDADNNAELIHKWQRDTYNRPFIDGWYEFNISHSGDVIVLSYGEYPLGIDIENNRSIDVTQLVSYFHKDEQNYIEKAINKEAAFYEIWVKKEAYYKAIGKGLLMGLDKANCLASPLAFDGEEYSFYPLFIREDYTAYLCTKIDLTINITQFTL